MKDEYVVLTADLLKYMNAWVEKHNARFPMLDFYPGRKTVKGYGALRYLADQMTSGTFRTRYNRVQRIRKGITHVTDLWIADEILTAMGDIHLLQSEIAVYPRSKFYNGQNKRLFKVQVA